MKTTVGKNIKKAIEFLNAGEIIAMPTETVYGLAANALDQNAVKNLFEIKKRPYTQAISIQVASFKEINALVKQIPQHAHVLAENFWPGPLTMLLEKNSSISDLVTANKKTIGIRIPNDKMSLELLKKIPYPLAVPSANIHNEISCTNAEDVFQKFKNKIKYILDGGNSKKGLESTIIGFTENKLIIYRLGVISINEIKNVFNDQITIIDKSNQRNHFNLKTQILKFNKEYTFDENSKNKIGLIHFDTEFTSVIPKKNQAVLSPSSDINEATKRLYKAIHKLNQQKLDIIYIKPFPNIGIGISINKLIDRITT